VLQEGQIERVGDDETRRVDVRVIAATNRQLSDEVAAGWFRQDLYFRLSVFPIEVAPLRARLEDIPLLAEYFLKRVCQKLRRPSMRLSDRAIDHLQRYAWPGNVRELQNVIERAVISSPDGRLRLDGLLTSSHGGSAPMTQTRSTRLPLPALTRESLRRIEAEGLLAVMERTNWKVYGPRGAAQLLGLPPTTLASRLKRLGLRRPD
jgi:transcriptional regulator with GAF, ATPase, and Fis domain